MRQLSSLPTRKCLRRARLMKRLSLPRKASRKRPLRLLSKRLMT
jgi:hypothetical protein